MATLVGKWDITTVNKDRVTTSSPLYEKAFKSSQCTGCIIEKTVKDDSDEISLTFETNRSTKLKLYLQPGVLNFESVKGNDISLCIVQSCSGSLDEFKVVRLGPKKGQRR